MMSLISHRIRQLCGIQKAPPLMTKRRSRKNHSSLYHSYMAFCTIGFYDRIAAALTCGTRLCLLSVQQSCSKTTFIPSCGCTPSNDSSLCTGAGTTPSFHCISLIHSLQNDKHSTMIQFLSHIVNTFLEFATEINFCQHSPGGNPLFGNKGLSPRPLS